MNATVPFVNFIFRENGEFVNKTTNDIFSNKRVVIFSLPGAFTPTCSAYQLPGFEELYELIKSHNIDEIYCISVNDAFVMNAWAKDQNISKVKLIPDGNGDFTRGIGMLVEKRNLGFSYRSWRYAAVIDNGNVEKFFVEQGMADNVFEDPYVESKPEKVLEYLTSIS